MESICLKLAKEKIVEIEIAKKEKYERWFKQRNMEKNFSVLRAEAAPDSITLYWERPQGRFKTTYEIFLKDGTGTKDAISVGSTQKTHYTIEDLSADTEYEVTVKGTYLSDIHEETITVHTSCRTVVIDITKAPYSAVGDGKTLNTTAIQAAIDDCPAGGCVWIPSGIFMTGALRLHSNMELYLAESAVLQGTATPEDYLPRIWSRFEGTEMEC